MEFSSLNSLFRWRAQNDGGKVAFLQKREGRWNEVTWKRYYDTVRHIALGLNSLGVQKGERVALLSASRAEWAYCDLAILSLGALTVPIYPTSPARDIRYILNHSQAKILVVESPLLLDKVLEVRADLEYLTRIVLLDGPPPDDEKGILMLSRVVELGRQLPEARFEQLACAVEPADDATIIYTSTSGPLMGVVLGHAQLLAQQEALAKVLPISSSDTALLLLPLAHIFGRTLEYANLYSGLRLAFAEAHEQLEVSLSEINPQLLATVPRTYQKIYTSVVKEAEMQGRLARGLFAWCRQVGEETALGQRRNRLIPLSLRLRNQAAHWLYFERFRRRFGRNLRVLVSSGAPLPLEVGEFFSAAELPILEAYGMTESAGAVTISTPKAFRVGAVGRVIAGCEIKLAEDGEILVKGPGVMRGYWHDPETTALVLRDGWLYTGDIGEMDADGFLRITDRKKDIIITSGGKKLSPLIIENLFKSDLFIDHLYVHGDRRNFVSALLTLNRENLNAWARERNIPSGDFAELSERPEVKRLIEERILTRNKELAGYEAIKKFAILPEAFSVEGGELTSTMKLSRRTIAQKYGEILDGFYR